MMKESYEFHIGGWTRFARRMSAVASESSLALFLLPALAIYALFFLWPLVQLVELSFVHWDGLTKKTSAGFGNYAALIHDSNFWQALEHNVFWLLAGVTLPTAIGLGFAIILVRGNIHGRAIFRTLLFLPQVLSSVVVAVVWEWIYNPVSGALNRGLTAAGLRGHDWLGDPSLVLPALFAAWTWISYGFAMVVFAAALQTIDEDYFDAAKMDGANRVQQLRHVLLPSIRRPLNVVILIMAISAFQVFDLVFIMTSGGPFGSSNVLELYMYDNAFQYYKVGYGAAIATTLGLLIVIFSLVFLRARRVTEETS